MCSDPEEEEEEDAPKLPSAAVDTPTPRKHGGADADADADTPTMSLALLDARAHHTAPQASPSFADSHGHPCDAADGHEPRILVVARLHHGRTAGHPVAFGDACSACVAGLLRLHGAIFGSLGISGQRDIITDSCFSTFPCGDLWVTGIPSKLYHIQQLPTCLNMNQTFGNF